MQDFYKKALIALILLLAADALVAVFCVLQSYPSAELMPPGRGSTDWRVVTTTDEKEGGTSTVRPQLQPALVALRLQAHDRDDLSIRVGRDADGG